MCLPLQEIEPRCGEALCRLFPPDDNIDLKAIALKAKRSRRQVAEEQKREFGEADLKTVAAINNLSQSYSSMGRYNDAEPLCRQAMEIAGGLEVEGVLRTHDHVGRPDPDSVSQEGDLTAGEPSHRESRRRGRRLARDHTWQGLDGSSDRAMTAYRQGLRVDDLQCAPAEREHAVRSVLCGGRLPRRLFRASRREDDGS